MDKVIDFSNCRRAFVDYGGSDRKFGVYYNDQIYLIKFSEDHAKKSDISTSHVNNVISEYISSHISASIGLPTHETYLGLYKDEIVVGCKDFRGTGERNIEFSELMKAVYESKDVKRHVLLNQIYDTLNNPINELGRQLIDDSVKRYWDTFVVDAFVGNFDRHMGNWGFISSIENKLRLSPVYDYGSSLFPKLSDEGAVEYRKEQFEMLRRCIVFPSSALCVTKEKVGKVGYYDMLSSNYDKNCTDAVLRIVPKIDMEKVYEIINETPFLTDIRKDFYKEILALRKEIVIDRAYEKCLAREYDEVSYHNIVHGISRDDKDVTDLIRQRSQEIEGEQEEDEHLFEEDDFDR